MGILHLHGQSAGVFVVGVVEDSGFVVVGSIESRREVKELTS